MKIEKLILIDSFECEKCGNDEDLWFVKIELEGKTRHIILCNRCVYDFQRLLEIFDDKALIQKALWEAK